MHGTACCKVAVQDGAAVLPVDRRVNSAAAALCTELLTGDRSTVTRGAGPVRVRSQVVVAAHTQELVTGAVNIQKLFLAEGTGKAPSLPNNHISSQKQAYLAGKTGIFVPRSSINM